MRRLTKSRSYSLLLTLCLLLVWGAAGCTDKDREMGPAPEPSADTIKYRFQQDSAAKVSAEMKDVSVAAFDADWNLLDGAFLYEDDIEDMDRDGDYIVAEAVVPEGTARLAYCFTNDPDGEAEDEEAEIYVIALEEGKSVYTMADGDYLEEPVLKVYADAGHQTEQYEFTAGDELYPVASVSTRGGLEVPATVFEPVDAGVVSYTEDSETGETQYLAEAEGSTAFILGAAKIFIFNSEEEVTVKAAVPGPEPAPEPTPTPEPSASPEPTPSPSPEPGTAAAWILPEGYEIKDGLIYDSEGAQVSDPAEIDAQLELVPGESCKCMAVETVTAADGSVTYKTLTAAITPSVESETAAHFSAAAEDGAVTVSVSEDAETEETAAIVFSAAGCEFKNRLEVTVASAMRRITVRLQNNTAAASPSPMPTVTLSPMPTVTPSPMPSPGSSHQFEQVVKVVALDSGGGLLPGAVLVDGGVSGEPDAEGYTNFVIDIPRQTESAAFIAAQKVVGAEENSSASAENAERFATVLPFLGIPIGEEDTYTISEEDREKYMFVNMMSPGSKVLKGGFGFYADDKFTESLSMSKSVYVGVKVYFCPEAENALGVKIICDKPISTDSGMFDYADGVLTAKKAGTAFFIYDWYGFAGILSIVPLPMPSFVVRA